jgi:hypothetical protein
MDEHWPRLARELAGHVAEDQVAYAKALFFKTASNAVDYKRRSRAEDPEDDAATTAGTATPATTAGPADTPTTAGTATPATTVGAAATTARRRSNRLGH